MKNNHDKSQVHGESNSPLYFIISLLFVACSLVYLYLEPLK